MLCAMPKFKFDDKDQVRGDGGRRKNPRHDPMARPTLERQVCGVIPAGRCMHFDLRRRKRELKRKRDVLTPPSMTAAPLHRSKARRSRSYSRDKTGKRRLKVGSTRK